MNKEFGIWALKTAGLVVHDIMAAIKEHPGTDAILHAYTGDFILSEEAS
jgi:hypothetical protein